MILNSLIFRSLTFEMDPMFHFHYMQISPRPLYMVRYCIIAIVLLGGILVSTVFLFKTKIQAEREDIACYWQM